MMPPLPSLSIAALTTAPVACVAVSGTGFGGSTMMSAGLLGLAALTFFSERWRRRGALGRADVAVRDVPAKSEAAPPTH
jgi:hypothetical protein